MACGLALKSGGEKVIVVAGGESTEEPHELATSDIFYWSRKLWERGVQQIDNQKIAENNHALHYRTITSHPKDMDG